MDTVYSFPSYAHRSPYARRELRIINISGGIEHLFAVLLVNMYEIYVRNRRNMYLTGRNENVIQIPTI